MVDDSCWSSGGHSTPGVFRYMPQFVPLHRLHSHSTPGIFGFMPLHRLHLACGGEPLSPFRSQGLLRPKYTPTLNHYKHTDPPSKLWWFAWPSTHYRYHTPITARDSEEINKMPRSRRKSQETVRRHNVMNNSTRKVDLAMKLKGTLSLTWVRRRVRKWSVVVIHWVPVHASER